MARGDKSKRRRGARHRLNGRPARGLEWVIDCAIEQGGRHRKPAASAGGLLAAGVALLAASSASPSAAPIDAADTQQKPSENQERSQGAGGNTPPSAKLPSTFVTVTQVGDRTTTLPAIPVSYTGGIPTTVLDAYRRARDAINLAQPNCHLPLELLAAIGKVETGHARHGAVDAHGTTVRPILGPVLDGNGFASIGDTDDGAYDGDTVWDRAVGPMQFIPGTWKRWASDGNGDRRSDPHNVYDASLAAARYLCAANRDLGTPQGLSEGILSYNHSTSYKNLVLAWMEAYKRGLTAVPDGSYLGYPTSVQAMPAPAGSQPTTPPTTTPPTTTPPGSTPPGSTPPGSTPPGSTPPGSTPPGSTPPGSTPPGSTPPGSTPPNSEQPPPSSEQPPPSSEQPTTPPAEEPTQEEPSGGLLCGVTGLIGGLLNPITGCQPEQEQQAAATP